MEVLSETSDLLMKSVWRLKMRALNDRELDSVSGGFGLLGNLLGGLFGGSSNGNGQSALAPAANTNTIPAANYAPNGYAVNGYVPNGYAAAAANPAGSLLQSIAAPVLAITNFLQDPFGSIISLIGTGIQQAVNFVTRLI